MKRSIATRVLSVFLAVLILCSAFASSASAAAAEYCLPKKHTPVIMISGFAASPLAEKTADGKLKPIYPPSKLQIAKALGLNANDLLGALLKMNDEQLKSAVEKIANMFLARLEMNPDGTSKYDIVPYLASAKESNLAALKLNLNTKYIPYGTSEFFNMKSLGKAVGDRNVFNFMYDWRLSGKESADRLHEYIQEVLKLTGQKKVNIYAISQGTHVLGSYLYEYPDDNVVNNVFLDSPAMGGSSMVSDILSPNPIKFHYPEFFAFLETVIHTEGDLALITKAISEERLDNILGYTMQKVMLPVLKYAPVVWELCAPDMYQSAKAYHLDPVANAALINKVETGKARFASHIAETLRAQNEKGSVTILAGYGSPIFSGRNTSSDGVVDLNDATGATVAPLGEKFDFSYNQKVPTDKSLISPDRTVDLSSAYIPERTWLIKNYYHGQIEMDPLAYSLVMAVLTSKDKVSVKDAYSSMSYPQFSETKAPNSDVSVYFKSTGTQALPTFTSLTYKGNTVIVKNNSRTQKIAVTNMKCANGTFDFKMISPLILSPGQEMEVNFTGKVLRNNHADSIIITYRRMDLEFIKVEKRTVDFSIYEFYAGKSKLALTPASITRIKQLVNLTKQLQEQVNNIKKVIEVVTKIASGIPPIELPKPAPKPNTPPAVPAPNTVPQAVPAA